MKTFHFLIIGRVQGIGYRQFAKSQAKKLGLSGWVRNLPDDNVEAEVQGDKEAIDKFAKLLRQGPFMAEVKEVVVNETEREEKFEDFVIASTPETL